MLYLTVSEGCPLARGRDYHKTEALVRPHAVELIVIFAVSGGDEDCVGSIGGQLGRLGPKPVDSPKIRWTVA